MAAIAHGSAHEPHLEHARDVGLASESREMAVRDVAPKQGYGSADFAGVMIVIAIALAVLLLMR